MSVPFSSSSWRGVAVYAVATALLALVFRFWPEIDLWAARLLWTPEQGFFLAETWPVQLAYVGVNRLQDGLIICAVAALPFVIVARSGFFFQRRREIAFLILAGLIGPILIVNLIVKEHSGRARPRNVIEFGGEQNFTPAFALASECDDNCSFVSGHASLGFYLTAFALIARRRSARRAGIAAGIAAGTVFGVARMAEGAHFLSDVVFAGAITFAVVWVLYFWLIERDALSRLWPGAGPGRSENERFPGR